ncbi:MAG: DUF47 family protein [Candidatus Bathyarchaeota archaeon]
MALPLESAEQTRRVLLDICQDHMRKALDSLREVCLMITSYQNSNYAKVNKHSDNLIKLDEESTEIKRAMMKEVAAVGMVLMSREDFTRLSSEIGTMADYCEGISFRLAELSNRKWKVENDIIKDVGKLAEAALDCAIKLRETILSLSYGGARTLEIAKNVESAERIVDNLYRKVDVKIMTSSANLPVILMLREIAKFLEGIADVCENANDIAKILAITV